MVARRRGSVGRAWTACQEEGDSRPGGSNTDMSLDTLPNQHFSLFSLFKSALQVRQCDGEQRHQNYRAINAVIIGTTTVPCSNQLFGGFKMRSRGGELQGGTI